MILPYKLNWRYTNKTKAQLIQPIGEDRIYKNTKIQIDHNFNHQLLSTLINQHYLAFINNYFETF